MWEIIEAEDTEKDTIIPMCDMKPMQVGVIVDSQSLYKGRRVIRTQRTDEMEVMDLTLSGAGLSWTKEDVKSGPKVRLLRKGEYITVKLFNEE